jgi:hypothetical protein
MNVSITQTSLSMLPIAMKGLGERGIGVLLYRL